MESWTIPLSPETSSDEEKDTTKRSYECTFCKRGFTNAQALGGHMNIHRKDRAKAKQLSNQYRSSEDYISMSSASQFNAPMYTQPSSGYYPVMGHHEHNVQRNYHQMYYQPSESSPRFYGEDDHSRSSKSHHVNQDLWGANLSLRFSPTRSEDDDDFRMGGRRHEDVDLELRL